MGRRRFIFEFQNLRRHTQPDGCPRAVAKCARIDRRFFHKTFVQAGNAKTNPIFAKQSRLHRRDPGELLRSLPRKFKNMTGANCHFRQSTQINESLQRRGRFVDGTQPFSNLVQQTIIQYALWLPGNQIMSGILPQVSRPRDNPGSRQRFRIISRIVRHNGYLRTCARAQAGCTLFHPNL